MEHDQDSLGADEAPKSEEQDSRTDEQKRDEKARRLPRVDRSARKDSSVSTVVRLGVALLIAASSLGHQTRASTPASDAGQGDPGSHVYGGVR